MILKKVVIFLKCYVKIKTLGSTFQEPIYAISTKTDKEEKIFFSNLVLDRFKAEGRFISIFQKDITILEDKGEIPFEKEKDLFSDFLLYLTNNDIDEIVVEDKLKQMLNIEERMKMNKFKTETYRFRHYKLSEEPENSFFAGEEKENNKKGISQKIRELLNESNNF